MDPARGANRRELLAGIAADLLRFNDPARLLGAVFQRISSEMQVDVCVSFFPVNGALEVAFIGGWPAHLDGEMSPRRFGPALFQIAACRQSHLQYKSILVSNEPETASLRQLGVNALCCYPLFTDGELVGTLSFGSRAEPFFSDEQIELQSVIADQVALAYSRMILRDELAKSKQALMSADSELKGARTELEQIAFSVSHDLREPVRHLSIYTELLQRQLQPRLAAEARQQLRFVLTNAKRVELLVSDLLRYTGLSREEPVAREIDAGALVANVCSKLRPLIKQTGSRVQIARDLPRLAMAEDDATALFENLIENAIVHGRRDAAPDVQVFSYLKNEAPVFCVRDNGHGIDRQHQHTIFGLFKRLHPRQEVERTGVGLTLCQKIVERYKGQIWVESEPGEGALFCFTIAKPGSHAKALAAHSSS